MGGDGGDGDDDDDDGDEGDDDGDGDGGDALVLIPATELSSRPPGDTPRSPRRQEESSMAPQEDRKTEDRKIGRRTNYIFKASTL